MELELKYSIGDEVYVVFKENYKVNVLKGKIEEFCYSGKYGLDYYIDGVCEEFKEDDIIPVNDKDGLVKKIDELMKNDNK